MSTSDMRPGRFSFSLAGLFSSVSLLSVACAALVYPTQLWASVISSLTLAVLTLAVIAAVIFHGEARAFWGGFAFVGWLFVIGEFVHLPLINFEKEWILPNLLATEIGNWRYSGNSNWTFGYIFRWLSALLLAWFGGHFARWCFRESQRQLATNRDS
jgi:hypothetical protein